MSKNVQMHSFHSIAVGADRATTGAAAAIQGAYGARGNLELVACDALDGLWVFWFNSDLDTDPLDTPDVPPGSWSAGLHFAAGARYTEATILQSPLGPNHLEVLALDADGTLQSWYWSPGPAFQRRERDAATGVESFAASIATDGTLTIDCVTNPGAVRVVSSPHGYPHRQWHHEEIDRVSPRDADTELRGRGVTDFRPGTSRATTSVRDGGTREFTYRDAAGTLRHWGAAL